MSNRAELLVVAQQPLYAMGLQSVLACAERGLHCLVAHSAAQALSLVRASKGLALVIADSRVDGTLAGLTLLQQMGRCRPGMPRVLMSDELDPGLARQARRAGIDAYLCKNMDAFEWLQAIGAVLEGRRDIPAFAGAPAPLSERQISVLQLAAIGLGNRQIAEKLHLTERTVKYHMTGSFQRLASASRTEAVARAAALGLITLPVH